MALKRVGDDAPDLTGEKELQDLLSKQAQGAEAAETAPASPAPVRPRSEVRQNKPQIPKAPPQYPDKGPVTPKNTDLDLRDLARLSAMKELGFTTYQAVLGEAIRLLYAFKEAERGERYVDTLRRMPKGSRPKGVDLALLEAPYASADDGEA